MTRWWPACLSAALVCGIFAKWSSSSMAPERATAGVAGSRGKSIDAPAPRSSFSQESRLSAATGERPLPAASQQPRSVSKPRLFTGQSAHHLPPRVSQEEYVARVQCDRPGDPSSCGDCLSDDQCGPGESCSLLFTQRKYRCLSSNCTSDDECPSGQGCFVTPPTAGRIPTRRCEANGTLDLGERCPWTPAVDHHIAEKGSFADKGFAEGRAVLPPIVAVKASLVPSGGAEAIAKRLAASISHAPRG